MPKLKRTDQDERATDFVEALDRGLRLLQVFGTVTGPATLSDLARAADLPRAPRAASCSRSRMVVLSPPTASCSR